MNVVLTNCTVDYGKEDPIGNKGAFQCIPDHGFPHKIVFRTRANIIYVKNTGKTVEFKLNCEKELNYFAAQHWRGIHLGEQECERTVEISLRDDDSIYVWPRIVFF